MADMIKVYGLSRADEPDNNPDFVTTYITPFVYLHGILADKNGFDLCWIVPFPKEEGIYDCEAILQNGETIPSKLYLYFIDNFHYEGERLNRGLVVANCDRIENIYANGCLQRHSPHL